MPTYVHAPYLVNAASPNDRIRIPSRRILQDTCDGAMQIGAAAVIVHGGHTDNRTTFEEGVRNWRKALERLETDVPIYIENTAGGDDALARRFDDHGRLWDAVGELGFCLDTCHAHAASERLDDAVDRLRSLVGRIDLVHVNDSRDPYGSGRDRQAHDTNPAETLVAVVRAAGAPVIIETPGDAAAQAADLAWLRRRVTGAEGGYLR